jgi:glycerol-3-phosphate dehydrogenase
VQTYDLVVVGGGINGAGVARDAAGRGLKVLLVERDDLAAHTSSASSKLVHGGLRYLERFEFRLVAESLAERSALLAIAPHLVRPMTFVLPHAAHLRPRWMIRVGLAFYDLFGARSGAFARSAGVNLRTHPFGAPLKPTFSAGFTYADGWVDDARLVVLTARSAADKGADIRTRTTCTSARRSGAAWLIQLEGRAGRETVQARSLVNATGAWAQTFCEQQIGAPPSGQLRLVKGSHIAVRKLYEGDHAYLLQNADGRVVFLFPYGEDLTAIGTTDIPLTGPTEVPIISSDEIAYLCAAASAFLTKPVVAADVVNTWSGVRALYDDGAHNAAKITRDYRLITQREQNAAPLISIFGGKITTYRRLAEHVMAELKPTFPKLGDGWTDHSPLPGGELEGGSIEVLLRDCVAQYSSLDAMRIKALVRRYGTGARAMLSTIYAQPASDREVCSGLYQVELKHLVENEWATCADDVLWRRTKLGLRASADDAARITRAIEALQNEHQIAD